MTIATWLFETMKKLGDAGVDAPRRDALVLLEDTLEKDRSWVLAHSDHELTDSELEHVNHLVNQRLAREPLAYIRGKAWFYGRFFEVNSHVLIPRPESEEIIDLTKELKPQSIVDVGTGSGCLAITCRLELPDCHVMASDISHDAVEIARSNAYAHGVEIEFHEGYFLEGLLEKTSPDLVIANLPYVPDHLITSPEIQAEPKLALFAGQDGMDAYQSFWAQLSITHHKPGHVMVESLESQHTQMQHLAERAGYTLDRTRTLVQLFRFG